MYFVSKGSIVEVKCIIGMTAEPFLDLQPDGRFMFNDDCYVQGEKSSGGFYHLRQARKYYPDKEIGNNIRFWPRLRKALRLSAVEPVHIPGGNPPIHYKDELVVPDYMDSGSYYYIVKYEDIPKYLERLPLDEHGKQRAIQNMEEAEHSRKFHDSKYIAKVIGKKIWFLYGFKLAGEFKRITLVSENNDECSIIYPACKTDLMWQPGDSRIVCEAPDETGLEYLSGFTAGRVNPNNHRRIRQRYIENRGKSSAYMMPNPELAQYVKEDYRWMNLFDSPDNSGFNPQKIVDAKQIYIECFDINDNLLRERIVYTKKDKSVVSELIF